MKIRIEILTAAGDLLATDAVEISTNPDHIRAAKLEAAALVEEAVNVLLERAVGAA